MSMASQAEGEPLLRSTDCAATSTRERIEIMGTDVARATCAGGSSPDIIF